MRVKLRVLRVQDNSFTGKKGKVEQMQMTCADPEETLLDNIDAVCTMEDFKTLRGKDKPDGSLKGQIIDVAVTRIRAGFGRMELTVEPVPK